MRVYCDVAGGDGDDGGDASSSQAKSHALGLPIPKASQREEDRVEINNN